MEQIVSHSQDNIPYYTVYSLKLIFLKKPARYKTEVDCVYNMVSLRIV